MQFAVLLVLMAAICLAAPREGPTPRTTTTTARYNDQELQNTLGEAAGHIGQLLPDRTGSRRV